MRNLALVVTAQECNEIEELNLDEIRFKQNYDEEKNGEENTNEVNNIYEEVFRQHNKKDLIDEEPATTRVEKESPSRITQDKHWEAKTGSRKT